MGIDGRIGSITADDGRVGHYRMDESVLEKLQFGRVRTLLGDRCGSSLGRELCARIAPATSITQVERWLAQVRELQEVVEEIGLPPLGGVKDIRKIIGGSASPAGLEADAMVDVADTLAATGYLCTWGEKLPENAPTIHGLLNRVENFTPVAERIREIIDERGEVRDEASRKLANIRATIARAKSQIGVVFDRLLRQSSVTKCLQYSGVTFHNDRKVLPLKAEHRGRVQGIVHRSSDSGATLFVEPAEVVELNNTIVKLGLDAHKEITRILLELSRIVHANEVEILKALNAIAVLDLLSAKIRYAKEFRAIVPEVSESGVLDLREARHPLLAEMFAKEAKEAEEALKAAKPGKNGKDLACREVVPIDMRLGDDFDILVITGPNTGGKTVALKTVGLLVLMAQAGIPIPVSEGSMVPVYRKVFVDIGDEQSIEQSLSTFSSHLSNVLNILQRSGKGSLVLIDEMGSGTDPDEGAAIGRAVLGELRRLGAHALMTTHLSAMKAAAFTVDRVDNACVEFDVETLEPLYRVRIGEPGNSNALIIAARLGMSKSLIHEAKQHLDGRSQALKKAIAGTLSSRRKAEEARTAAHKAQMDADRQKIEMERQSAALDEARKTHERWVKWVNQLDAGDEVFVQSFDRVGKVVRMLFSKQSALVATGMMELEVRLNDLAPPEMADE